jgi:polyhydroxyalkanoate synthesis regulator phasin
MRSTNSNSSSIAVAIAGGAIAIALIDNLIERGVLTTQNGRDVLAEAQRRLAPFGHTADATEAVRIISMLLQGLPDTSPYSGIQ